MRTVIVLFTVLLPLCALAQTYRVSELKFENFKAYEPYDIAIDDIRQVLLEFSKANPSFDQSGLFLLAAELAEIYRQKGLAFHRVEVVLGNPPRLVLVPGVMGSVDIRGNQLYRDNQLLPYFADLQGKLVDNKTLQSAMARVNSLPGMQAFAFLSFGQRPGEAVLNVSASQESWGEVTSQLNNYGTATTGEHRLASQITLNNLFKQAEQWRLGGSISENSANWSVNAAVEWQSSNNSQWSVEAQYQRLALAQEFSWSNMSGWQGYGFVGWQSTPLQRLNSTFELQARAGYQQQSLTSDNNFSFLDIRFQELPIALAMSGDFAGNKSYLGYEFKTEAGWLLSYEAPTELENSLWQTLSSKISFAQSITGGALQQGVDWKNQIHAQYGVSKLPAHRRFGLTGANRVANLPAGQFTVDSGLFAETNLVVLNWRVGNLQSVWQLTGQAGMGEIDGDAIDPLFAVGTGLDINFGALNSGLRFMVDEEFSQPKLWFELSLNWPKG